MLAALFRHTLASGNDLQVYWKMSRFVLEGLPVYDPLRDGGSIFKYPPWVAAMFLPFGFFSYQVFSWMWAILQTIAFVWLLRFLIRITKSKGVTLSVFLGFWGLWAVHAFEGQINLLLLVLMLQVGEKMPWRTMALLVLSSKITTLLPLVGLRWPTRVRPAFLWAGGLAALLTLGVSLLSHESVIQLTQSYFHAVFSGDTLLGRDKIYSRDNQGIYAFIQRLFISKGNSPLPEAPLMLAVLVLGSASWWHLSRQVNDRDRYWGWIALVPVLHGLAWFHMFVFAFPLAVAVVADAFRTKRWSQRAWAIASVGLVGAVTAKTFGPLGGGLEFFSVKSVGTLSLLAQLRNQKSLR